MAQDIRCTPEGYATFLLKMAEVAKENAARAKSMSDKHGVKKWLECETQSRKQAASRRYCRKASHRYGLINGDPMAIARAIDRGPN